MRPQRTLSALLIATLTLTACSSLFSSSGPSGVTEEQVRNACESTWQVRQIAVGTPRVALI